LWKFDQYASLTLNMHSILGTFAHIWSNWDPTFVVVSLNYDFNWNLSMKYNVFFLGGWLLSFIISTLKSPIMIIRQCLEDCWIIVWRLFRNVEIEHEWTPCTHTIYILCIRIKNYCYIFWTITSYCIKGIYVYVYVHHH